MKALLRKLSIALFLTLVIGAVPGRAENKGYAFVFAYSHRLKQAYHTPVYTHAVKSKSLNEDEYVADIKVIRQMEEALEKHLRIQRQTDTGFFSFTARTGYKREDIAQRQLEIEKSNLRRQGIEMHPLPDFSFEH